MQASDNRYDTMIYNRCGRSGLKLPAISLGLWHNFGGVDPFETAREMICSAFDLGITHFDLANNYGPPPGSAEETFGRILASELKSYRDEIVISSKAGYGCGPDLTVTGDPGSIWSRAAIRAWPGWVSTTWTSSTTTVWIRRRRSRKR